MKDLMLFISLNYSKIIIIIIKNSGDLLIGTVDLQHPPIFSRYIFKKLEFLYNCRRYLIQLEIVYTLHFSVCVLHNIDIIFIYFLKKHIHKLML